MAEFDDVQEPFQEREIVALFESEAELNRAVDALLQLGVPREDMSALVTATQEEGLQSAGEEADSTSLRRETYKSPEERAEGASALVAAPAYVLGAGAAAIIATSGAALIPIIAVTAGSTVAGGAIGLLLARLVGRRHAQRVEMQLASGGLVLWVHNENPDKDSEIIDALAAQGGRHVHVHVAHRTWGAKDAPLSSFNPDPLLERD